MTADFRDLLQSYADEPLTHQVMKHLLKEYRRPNDKIHELVRSGILVPLRRGLYVAGPNVKTEKPSLFLLANHMRGPSYISLETALSHWGLIPERVYETVSVTLESSKLYQTPAGRFRYLHATLPYYAFGIASILITPRQRVLIATPEKALCDKIVLTSGIFLRSVRSTKEFLIDDLRLEEEGLRRLRLPELRAWEKEAPKSQSIGMLIKTLEQL
ncbi:MAG TPA: hypothetical protein VHK91_01875 [Flavisolibacter sp.]|jgi:hypothetical protein|nr:hypothetical protein [Flavisolibacter sp.]